MYQQQLLLTRLGCWVGLILNAVGLLVWGGLGLLTTLLVIIELAILSPRLRLGAFNPLTWDWLMSISSRGDFSNLEQRIRKTSFRLDPVLADT